MKPAGTRKRRPPKGLEFKREFEPDMSRAVIAPKAVIESRPKESAPAVDEKQVG